MTRVREDDELVITEHHVRHVEEDFGTVIEESVTKIRRPCHIDMDRIEFKCEPDDDMGPPWREHDGWEHDCEEIEELGRYLDGAANDTFQHAVQYARGYYAGYGHIRSEPCLITVTDDSYCRDSRKDRWQRFHNKGASKQVAAEMVAQQDREYIDQLIDWYRYGYNWWWVRAEVTIDDKLYEASCGGIDDEDYARTDMRSEIISEVVYQLEKDGFVVVEDPAEEPKPVPLKKLGSGKRWCDGRKNNTGDSMGQYYRIVNRDRQEFLEPNEFGDGSKLLEFGCSSNGVMTALAILLSDGNGRGGGDICRTLNYTDDERQPEGWEPKDYERIENECTSPGWKSEDGSKFPDRHYRTMVPKVAGTWADCRIVVVGDYVDSPKYLTPQEWLRGLADKFPAQLAYENENRGRRNEMQYSYADRQPLSAEELAGQVPYYTYNYYDHAGLHYRDISSEVKEAMHAYGEGRCTPWTFHEQMEHMLSRRLLSEYPHMIEVRRSRRSKWDLRWVSVEMFDSLMRSWHDPGDLKKLKAWLRRQELTPWQRDVMKCYLGWRDGEEKIKRELLERTLNQYDLPRDPDNHHRYATPRVLPSREALNAALAIDNRDHEGCVQADDEAMVTRIAEVAGINIRPHRIIDLDGHDETTEEAVSQR